jgi:hypothetical protein
MMICSHVLCFFLLWKRNISLRLQHVKSPNRVLDLLLHMGYSGPDESQSLEMSARFPLQLSHIPYIITVLHITNDDDWKWWMLTWMLYFRHIWINVSCVLFHTVDTLTLTSLTCCRFDLAWNIYPWCKIAKNATHPQTQISNHAMFKSNPISTPPILILKEQLWIKTNSQFAFAIILRRCLRCFAPLALRATGASHRTPLIINSRFNAIRCSEKDQKYCNSSVLSIRII